MKSWKIIIGVLAGCVVVLGSLALWYRSQALDSKSAYEREVERITHAPVPHTALTYVDEDGTKWQLEHLRLGLKGERMFDKLIRQRADGTQVVRYYRWDEEQGRFVESPAARGEFGD